MRTKDLILLGAGYAAGRMSKKMSAGPIGAVKKKYGVTVIDIKSNQPMYFSTQYKKDAIDFANYYRRKNRPKSKKYEVKMQSL